MNLILNARDAVTLGGSVTFQAKAKRIHRPIQFNNTILQPGQYVEICVKDDGCGMTLEQQERVFEPFYTTKGPGKGTGLGLAVVYGIVSRAGGALDLRSSSHSGTEIRVLFPQIEALRSRTAKLIPAPRSSCSILLVEDEPLVRAAVERLLQHLGHTVHGFSGPEAAIEWIASPNRPPVDVVLTDVLMPDMDGPSMFRRISRLCPQLSVIYMSGYAADKLRHRGILTASEQFIQKPLVVEELRKAISRAAMPPSSVQTSAYTTAK